MPNNRFFHLLSLHPKYTFMKKNLLHFHQSANPKATGEGLVHRSHHRRSHHSLAGRGWISDPGDTGGQESNHHRIGSGSMGHKHRRPAPLKFKL